MLDVRRLALLREVSLHSGLTATAQALGLSVSSVSQQLSRLQQDSGVTLLEPAGRGVRLTPEAERLVARTERVLEILEEAEVELKSSRGGLTGVVRIVAFRTWAASLLVPTMHHLRSIAPRLSIEFVQMDPEDAIRELTARRADIVIVDEYPGLPLPPNRGTVRADLGQDPIHLYLPAGADHADLTAENTAEVLSRLPWVMEPRHSDAFHWARNLCRTIGFEPKVVFESPSLDIHRMLVAEGAAAALLPRSVAGSLGVRVPYLPGLPEELHRTLLALVRRGTERAPTLVACRAALEAAFRELEASGPDA